MKFCAILSGPFSSLSHPSQDFENLLTTLPLSWLQSTYYSFKSFSTPSILLTISSFPPFSWLCDDEGFTQPFKLCLPDVLPTMSENFHHRLQPHPLWIAEDTTSPLCSFISRVLDLILTSKSMSHSKVRKTSKYVDQSPNSVLKQSWLENSQRPVCENVIHLEAQISSCSPPVSVVMFMGSD